MKIAPKREMSAQVSCRMERTMNEEEFQGTRSRGAEREQRNRRLERGEQDQRNILISGTFCLTVSCNFVKHFRQYV